MGITRIPHEVYERFEAQYRLYEERGGIDVWAVGETWLKIAEATERYGMTSATEHVEAVGEELLAEGRDPQQLCLVIFAERDIREEVGLPDSFEGYAVYLFVTPPAQEH